VHVDTVVGVGLWRDGIDGEEYVQTWKDGRFGGGIDWEISTSEGEKKKQRDQNVTRRGAGESNRTF
jgi:hypothetical protein